MFFVAYVLCSFFAFSNSNLKDQQYQQETVLKTYKTEIKILIIT